MSTFERIWNFVTGLFTERASRLALSALFFDLLFLAVPALVVANPSPQSPWRFSIPESYRPFFIAGFLISFPVIWYIFYIQTDKALTDIYSEVRKKMCGNWLITYSPTVDDDTKRVLVPERTVQCKITENLIRKLQMEFRIRGNSIFEDQGPQIVRDVALRDNEDGGYTVLYYYESKRRPIQKVRDLMEINDNHRREVDIEVFGIVRFADPTTGKTIDEMKGKWYDLNGNMMRIFTLIEDSERKGVAFVPISFDDIPISQIHFDADMGEVRFNYQGK